MIELLPALEAAVWALKTARDLFYKVTEHKDRCGALINRCEELVLHMCAQFPPGSPAQLDRELTKVKDACLAVKETTILLSRMNKIQVCFRKDEINHEIKKAEQHLADAFANFNIGADIKHIQFQEELGRALKNDRRHLFAYLDHLLKTKQTLAHEIESLPPISPSRNMPWTNDSQVFYPSPITPASSTSWHLRSDMVYQVDGGDPLSEGTVGQVRRGAIHGKIVAVKYLHEDTVKVLLSKKSIAESFERRIRTWIRLSHRNVNTFLGACLEGEQPFLVTEFCANGNVMEYIQKFPECNRLSILHQVSAGMLFLHNNDIIHANLKPGNILVHENHCVVVQDQEVARFKDDATLSASISRHNNLGTWNFMAPEYLDGEADYPADVYSFAMSAWQVHTGCVPFSQIPWRKLRAHVRTERPERPGSMNDQLWFCLQRCWTEEPRSRMKFVEIEVFLKILLDTKKMTNPLNVETCPSTSSSSCDKIHSPAGEFKRRGTALQLKINTKQVPLTPRLPTPISPVKPTAFASYSLSEMGKTAILEVIHSLTNPFSLEKLMKEILLLYPSWLKANNDSNHRTGYTRHVYQNNEIRGAIGKFSHKISAWVDQIQIPLYKEMVPISDPRRMLLYMTVICIMAEQAVSQKWRAPELHVAHFLRFSFARSDFKTYLEQACTNIWSNHKDSKFMDIITVCNEITLVVGKGCHMLTSS